MKSSSLFRGTAIVGGLTLISRVLGFFRDLLMAKLFGATQAADVFLVAFRIPNTVRAFIAEGALTSAFIPVLADERESSPERAERFFRESISALLIISLALCLLGFIFAREVVAVFAPGLSGDPSILSHIVRLFVIMLPFLPSISVVTIINGLLASLEHYGASSLAQIAMNLCMIAGLGVALFFPIDLQPEVLAWSVCASAAVQYGLLAVIARKVGISALPCRPALSPAIRKMLSLMTAAIMGSTVYQITILLNTALASLLPTGSISWLFYADRIFQLPIGIFTVALSSVLLPRLSENHAKRDGTAAHSQLINALRYSLFFLSPIAVIMFAQSEMIMSVLFERGAFTHNDSIQSANALSTYSFALLPLSLYTMLSRHLIAKKQPIIPACIGLCSLVVGMLVAIATMGEVSIETNQSFHVFIRSLQHLLPVHYSLYHVGLALSSVCAAITSLIISLVIVFIIEGVDPSKVIASAWRTGLASFISYWGYSRIAPYLSSSFPSLLTGTVTIFAFYYLVTFLLQTPELNELRARRRHRD